MSIYKLCGHVDCDRYDYDSALSDVCECNYEGHDPKKCLEDAIALAEQVITLDWI